MNGRRRPISRVRTAADSLRAGGADRLRAVGDAPPRVRPRAHRRRRRHVGLRLLPDARRAGPRDRRPHDRPALRRVAPALDRERPSSTPCTPTTPSMRPGSACAACRSSTSPPGTSPARSSRADRRRPRRRPTRSACRRRRSSATRPRSGRTPSPPRSASCGPRAGGASRCRSPGPRRVCRAVARRPGGGADGVGRLRRQHGLPHGRRRRPFDARVADLELGWIEDLVPPGDAALVADCRRAASTPVAMGDEQGG